MAETTSFLDTGKTPEALYSPPSDQIREAVYAPLGICACDTWEHSADKQAEEGGKAQKDDAKA